MADRKKSRSGARKPSPRKAPSPAKRSRKAPSPAAEAEEAAAADQKARTSSEHARAQRDYDPKASKEADKFAKDLSSFLEKSCDLEIQTLSERDSVPYWINSGSFAINWIVGNSFFDGIPGTKAVLVAGECLGPDTEIEVMVSDNLAKLLQANGSGMKMEQQMVRVKTTMGKLFDAVGKIDGTAFEDDRFHEPVNCAVRVMDGASQWRDVKRMVAKRKDTVKISFGGGRILECARSHPICADAIKACVLARDLAPGDALTTADGGTKIVMDVRPGQSLARVFDIEVDSDEHLYQTADGVVHHNSEKGKTLVTDVWLGQNIRNGGLSFKVDIEDAAGFKFAAQVVGSEEVAARIRLISPRTLAKKGKDGKPGQVDPADLIITIERLTTIINKLIDYQISKGKDKNPSVLIVIDSVSQLSSTKEITDIREEKDKRDMTAQQKMRALFRAITQTLRHANVTLVGIAHLTANIGVTFGDKKVVNAKGTAFGYASSLTLQAVSSKELADPKTKVPVGIRMKFKTKKNRIAFKGREAFLYLYFNRGIDPFGGLAELLAQYKLAKPSAKPAMDGSYPESVTFTYETSDGRTLKFKAKDTQRIVEENGGDALLQEWNDRLTAAYRSALEAQGITEDDLLATDSMEESGLEDLEERGDGEI